MKRFLPILAVAALIAVPAATARPSAPPTLESGKLIVAFGDPAPGFASGTVRGSTVTNPRGYEVDLASAVADGYATPKAVLALVDHQINTAFKWLGVFLVAFVVPDIYVFAAGDHVPLRAYFVLGVIVTITSTIAVIAFVKRVRAARVDRERAVRTSGFVEALESTVALRAPINSSLGVAAAAPPAEPSDEQ